MAIAPLCNIKEIVRGSGWKEIRARPILEAG
jgi:hypothetical protein